MTGNHERQGVTPELELRVEETPGSSETREQRKERKEKEWLWMKEAITSLLMRQLNIEQRTPVPPGFLTPMTSSPLHTQATAITGAPFQPPILTTPNAETPRSEKMTPFVPIRTSEGLLPAPVMAQQRETPLQRPEQVIKRTELPMFEGTNPEDWLFRIEKCFEVNKTLEFEKLDQALTCLSGPAVTWWRYSQGRETINSWSNFKEKFKVRFKPSRGSSSVDHLLSITQTGCVDDYRDRFEQLSVELPHVPDDVLESAFLRGLKKNLRDQVVRCRPTNMADIVEIARLIEAQENDSSSYQVRSQPISVPLSRANSFQQPSGWNHTKAGEFKRPTMTGDNRNPNPCRHCGERWFPDHRCKQRLKSLEVKKDVGDENNHENEHGGLVEENDQVTEQEIVTLHSMREVKAERYMMMKGRIGLKEVVVLIDSGATSNFISERLAPALGLEATETKGFGVRVGNGQVFNSKGKCTGVLLEIQGVEIMEEFLLFELGNIDVVMGYTWLATLGDTRINWGLLTLSWKIRSTWVTIVGDPSLCRGQASLNARERLIRRNGEVYLLELQILFESKKEPWENKETPLKHLRLVLETMKKNQWTEEAEAGFLALKNVVMSLPVLIIPDFTQEFTVETDASGAGIGVGLSQGRRPIAFLSQAFSSTGRIKSVYERELLAMGKTVTKWKQHFRRSQQGSETEVLVKLKGLPEFEATWEYVVTMMEQFPTFNLEDKVSSLPGSIDRSRIVWVFMKKKQRSKGRRNRMEKKVSASESG